MNNITLAGLRSKEGGCEQVAGVTPIIILTGDGEPTAKLTVTIPGFTTTQSTKPKPTVAFQSTILNRSQMPGNKLGGEGSVEIVTIIRFVQLIKT